MDAYSADGWGWYEPGYTPLCGLSDDALGSWDEPTGLGETPAVFYEPALCLLALNDTGNHAVPELPMVNETIEVPVVVLVAPPIVEIEPARPPPPAITVRETLRLLVQARRKVRRGNVEASLLDYQALIRAHEELEAVHADLSRLLVQDAYRQHVFMRCLLGDALVRQGKIPDALVVYRQALRLL